MKKIIGRKVYDTGTAEELASWENGYASGDFHSASEKLFRSPRGQLFIYGWGGALTEYAEEIGSDRTEGEMIWLVDDADAVEWMERRDLAAEAEKLFPDLVEAG